MDEAKSESDFMEIDKIYLKIGEYAKEMGVTVHIISIIGEECNLETLTKVCEMTGGDVERVDPNNLVDNFSQILNNKTIATNVELKVKLHRGLEFKNEPLQALSQNKTILTKELGNITEE